MVIRKKNRLEILFYISLKFILNKILKREGEVLPVHILKKIDKNIFDDFAAYAGAANIPIIVVTGTNGKTTTANLITETLKNSGKTVCSNASGANMPNGIFGAIIDSFKTFEFLSDFIVIECDEKVFPYIVSKFNPDVIVITNFYRDQLDRYGEVNSTVFSVKKAINGLNKKPILVLPAFEPLASFIGYEMENPKLYYGFDEKFFKGKSISAKVEEDKAIITDALTCPQCGGVLLTGNKLSEDAFLLNFKCEKCGFANFNADVCAIYDSSERIKIISQGDSLDNDIFLFKPVLTGSYNIANYLAAYSALKNFKILGDTIKLSFENFKTKFGRSYKKSLKSLEINIDLVKNPTGFNRVLEKITENNDSNSFSRKNILFAFSDRDADGRDVSWIWDVGFEKYIGNIGKIVITGRRPFDLAIRLKAAGVDVKNITVEYNLKKAVKKIFKISEEQGHSDKKIYILPTYTELLRLKNIL